MKKTIYLIIIAALLASCNGRSNAGTAADRQTEKSKKRVISFMEEELKSQTPGAERSIDAEGWITVARDNEGFKIDPAKIVYGEIDGNGNTDAVVPVYVFRGESLLWFKHYVIIDSVNSYRVAKVFDDVLSVLAITDKKIVAEVSTVTPDSPGYGCSECKVILQFIYRDGEVVKVQ